MRHVVFGRIAQRVHATWPLDAISLICEVRMTHDFGDLDRRDRPNLFLSAGAETAMLRNPSGPETRGRSKEPGLLIPAYLPVL